MKLTKDTITESSVQRFWAKVQKAESCWEWIAARYLSGYGHFAVTKRLHTSAHRFSWTLANGDVPDGLFVLHTCDNRTCVNPGHLFIGTQQDNMDDMRRKGRGATGDRNGARLHPERIVRGEDCKNARFTEPDVIKMHDMRTRGFTLDEIARTFGSNFSQIGTILRGGAWSHIYEKLGPMHKKQMRKGEAVHTAKLTEKQVVNIIALHSSGLNNAEIGRTYGVARSNIRAIVTGKSWKHIHHALLAQQEDPDA